MKLQSTFETPAVSLDFEAGRLEFTGRSLPEDTTNFYRPILNWIDNYIQNPNLKTEIDIKLEYFNTATSKVLLNLLSKFKNSRDVKVNWFHYEEDEDMLESGKEYEELVKIPFSFQTME